jgi:hypothetical protein
MAMVAAAVCAAAPGWAADSTTFTGTTVGGPLWNRPEEGAPPTALSLLGTAVPYSVQQLQTDLTAPYTFLDTSTSPLDWDNYTFLYRDGFDAGSPLAQVLIGNDDFGLVGVSGFTFVLEAGVDYFFVTTGRTNGDAGAFSATITGPTAVSLVPEPSTLAGLFWLGGLGALAARRRVRSGVQGSGRGF